MRDIKFRGKRVDNGEEVKGNLVSYFGETFILPCKIPAEDCVNIDVSTVKNIGKMVVQVRADTIQIEVCGQWFSGKELSKIAEGITPESCTIHDKEK